MFSNIFVRYTNIPIHVKKLKKIHTIQFNYISNTLRYPKSSILIANTYRQYLSPILIANTYRQYLSPILIANTYQFYYLNITMLANTRRTLRETRENEEIRQIHNVSLSYDVIQLHSNCIPLPNCNVGNIAAYKQQINAILVLLQQQSYRVQYVPQSSTWELDYGYESRPMFDRCESSQQRMICLKKRHVITDCILAARERLKHNITNPEQPHMEADNTPVGINWEYSIFNLDKDYSIWTTVKVAFYYDVNKKVFFINVSKYRGMNHVKQDIIRHITEQL